MELAAVDDIPSEHDALRDVLAQLGERVAPIALAHERTLPVDESLRGLFPEQGLLRGRVMSCRGAASSSIAFALACAALTEGAWMAAIDVDTFGADAAAELGVPLERVVRVDTRASTASGASSAHHVADWIDVMGAAADGFDIIVTRVPAALHTDRRSAAVRKLGTRVQQRGAVVLVLGDAGSLGSDVTLTTQRTVWSGLGQGFGHLRQRRVDVEAAGRRQPNVRSCSLELVGAGGRVELHAAGSMRSDAGGVVVEHRSIDMSGADTSGAGTFDADADPQARVLAEMRAGLRDDHLAAG